MLTSGIVLVLLGVGLIYDGGIRRASVATWLTGVLAGGGGVYLLLVWATS